MVVMAESRAEVVGGSQGVSTPTLWKIGGILMLLLAALPLPAREKSGTEYGTGLIVNIPFPEAEVAQAVQDVVQNGIIRGSKEYNKDEYITGANPAASTKVFPQWAEGGKVFYKVRLKALDPRNFKDSSDVGTLAVRYVVQPQGDKNTVLRIDARFVEDFRHSGHPSNGSVEGAEYKDIHDHLEALELMKAQTVEAQKEKQQQAAKMQVSAPIDPSTLKSRLKTLQENDLLVLYAGLEGWDFHCDPALYIIGFFSVSCAGLPKQLAEKFGSTEWREHFAENFHVRHSVVFEDQKDRLVLVKGDQMKSRLLKTAVRISAVGKNCAGRDIHVLSPEIQEIFGDFEGHISIHRSSPRWVLPTFAEKAVEFVSALQ